MKFLSPHSKQLVVVLLLTLVKGLMWVVIIPPWQAPDEPSHFAYVQYLAEENQLPLVQNSDGISAEEKNFARAAGIGDIKDQPNAGSMPSLKTLLDFPPGTKAEREASGNTAASGYPPGYYFLAALVYKLFYYKSIVVRFYAIRFFSVIISLFAVWGAFQIGKLIVPKSGTFPLALAVLTGMQPMFSMTAAQISNDILLDTLAVLILYWLFNLLTSTSPPSRKQLVLGGVLLGLGLLTKAQMLYVSAFACLVALIHFIRRKHKAGSIVRELALILAPAFVLYGWWAYFSWQHYHSVLGNMPFQPVGSPDETLSGYIRQNFFTATGWQRQYTLWVKWYWANFGWLDTGFRSYRLYQVLLGFMAIGLAGAVGGLFRWRGPKPQVRISLVVLSAAFYLGNIAFLYVVELVYFLRFHNTMLQGRYLLTALVPLNILILTGIRFLLPGRLQPYGDILMGVGAFALNVSALLLLLSEYHGIGVI